MKKAFLFFLFIVIAACSATAYSYVIGTVYYDAISEGHEFAGATVSATCNGYETPAVVTSSRPGNIGDYFTHFNDGECNIGDVITVTATYGDMSGTATGVMDGSEIVDIKVAAINVFLPEFSSLTAILALSGAAGLYFLRRKK